MQASAAKTAPLTALVQHHNKHLPAPLLPPTQPRGQVLPLNPFQSSPNSRSISQTLRQTCPSATGVPHTPSFRAKITEVRAYLSSIDLHFKATLFFPGATARPQGRFPGESTHARTLLLSDFPQTRRGIGQCQVKKSIIANTISARSEASLAGIQQEAREPGNTKNPEFQPVPLSLAA